MITDFFGSAKFGNIHIYICLVCSLMSQSTALVMQARSVHLTTLFSWPSLTKWVANTSWTYFLLLLKTTLLESAEGWRMAVEIISWSISTKVRDQAGINHATTGSAVVHIYAVWHLITAQHSLAYLWTLKLCLWG